MDKTEADQNMNVTWRNINIGYLSKYYFLLPDYHQENTTCHLMCEQSSSSGQNEYSNHYEPEHHIVCILDPHPAMHRKMEE